MYSSWFSHPISKPYPFRWFTPVVIVGTVVLTILFTLVNLASSAFYLKPIFTEDPNGTVADSTRWFMKTPFNWDSNLETKCQPKMLSPGENFFTTNLGFQYTIKRIAQAHTSGATKSYSSVPYLNNTLQNCYLRYVQIDLVKSDTEAMPTGWHSWAKSQASARASCTIASDMGPVTLELEPVYRGRTDYVYDYVIDDNYTTHASTWWGSRLLNVYFAGILQVMSQSATINDSTYWTNGHMGYHRNKTYKDMHELGSFDLSAWFASSDGHRQVEGLNSTRIAHEDPQYVQIVSETLHYTKIFYSLVAVDLGNCQSSNLLREDDLAYAILPSDNPNRQLGGLLNNSMDSGDGERYRSIPSPRPRDGQVMLNETYKRIVSETGPLKCEEVRIVSQYLCSIPESKNPGVMLLAIVLANLVFLQASWKILNWVAEGMLPDLQRTTCQGCMSHTDQLLPTESMQVSGSYQEVSTSEGS